MKTWDKAPTMETYRVHPFMKQVDSTSPVDEEATEPKTVSEAPQRFARESNGETGSRRFGQISDPRQARLLRSLLQEAS